MSETITSREIPLNGALGKLLMGLVEAKMGASLGVDERPPLPVQAAALRSLRDRFEAKHALIPGQFVRYKDGLGALKDEKRANMAIMLWRLLDADNEQDQAVAIKWADEHRSGGRLDCVVAYICDDGHCLVPVPASLSELEPADYEQAA